MLCEKCNENEATIHFTEVINGVKSEHHLCAECAKETELGFSLLDSEFPFASLIKGILGTKDKLSDAQVNPLTQVICPNCGMNFEEFGKEGRFGCFECYNVFGPLIVDKIKTIQGSAKHNGKKYDAKVKKIALKPKTKKESIQSLQEQLKKAIEIEDYDQAASLRDEIKRQQERKQSNA